MQDEITNENIFSEIFEMVKIFEEKFGKYLHNMKWLNFGGGHHITREDYDIEKLVKCINYIKEKYPQTYNFIKSVENNQNNIQNYYGEK